MARLEIFAGDERDRHDLGEGTHTIGRRKDNDIVLSCVTVSGNHAEILHTNGKDVLRDLGSRNHTFVNGVEIHGPAELHHGDEIQFGKLVAKYIDPEFRGTEGGKRTVYGGGTVVMHEDDEEAQSSSAFHLDGSSVHFLADDTPSSIDSTLAANKGLRPLEVNPEKKLNGVLEISKKLAVSMELESLLPAILDTLFELFPIADRGSILLRDDQTGELVPRAMVQRRKKEDATFRLSRTILNRVIEKREAVLSADARNDKSIGEGDSIVDLKLRSVMCVPMLDHQSEPIGVISIDSQNQLGKFSTDDLDLLLSVASQAALTYDNARLFRSHLAKKKQDTELEIARNVQRALLPMELPDWGEYRFFATYEAATAVGGDYYDFLHLPNGKLCVSLGDVAGKGVPGALIMSRMHACVQSTMQHVHDVVPAMNAINHHMCKNRADGRFVTFVLGLLDPESHQICFADAGHPSPIIRRANGTLEEFDIEQFGLPIGVEESEEYHSETRSLYPGDTVVIITDGVNEAMNQHGTMYGEDRLQEFIRRGPADPRQLGKALLDDVRLHADGHPQSDDITIFVFGRQA